MNSSWAGYLHVLVKLGMNGYFIYREMQSSYVILASVDRSSQKEGCSTKVVVGQ